MRGIDSTELDKSLNKLKTSKQQQRQAHEGSKSIIAAIYCLKHWVSGKICKETEKNNLLAIERTGNRNRLEGALLLDLAFKYFKAVIINIFKELKEIMFKELKVGMMIMSHQREDINKNREKL